MTDIVLKMIRAEVLKQPDVADVEVKRTNGAFVAAVLPRDDQPPGDLKERISADLKNTFPELKIQIEIGGAGHSERSSSKIQLPENKRLKESHRSKGPILSRTRIELERIDFSALSRERFSLKVKLCRFGNQSKEVEKAGVYQIDTLVRLAAEATLEAALSFFPEDVTGVILGTKHLEIAYENLVVVLVALHLKEGQVRASGSASMRKGAHVGAVTATLKAINRYLEYYDQD